MRTPQEGEKGFVLLSWLVVSILVLAILVWYVQWTRVQNNAAVHSYGTQQAMTFADSGVNDVRERLQGANTGSWLYVNPSSTIYSAVTDGRYEAVMYPNHSNNSLVDIYSTGYYYITTGNILDAYAGLSTPTLARRAVVHATVQISNATQWMVATPNEYTVHCGRDFHEGSIYANNIQFDASCASPIIVSTVAYYSSVVPPMGQGAGYNITYMPPLTQAQQLAYSLNFPSLDSNMQAQYYAFANPNGLVTSDAFNGVIAPPAPAGSPPVYYYSGNLDIAQGSDLTVSGVYVLYVAGNAIIHGNINLQNPSSWIGILAQNDIEIAADSPTPLTLNGIFLTNQQFYDGSPVARPPIATCPNGSTMTINGSVTAMVGFGSAQYSCVTASYPSTFPSNLILPNNTQMLQYVILEGKYN